LLFASLLYFFVIHNFKVAHLSIDFCHFLFHPTKHDQLLPQLCFATSGDATGLAHERLVFYPLHCCCAKLFILTLNHQTRDIGALSLAFVFAS
jgi:hypothetical protein